MRGDQLARQWRVIRAIEASPNCRLALFSDTLTVFLKSLDESQFSRIPKAIQRWHSSESEGWFGLGPAEQKVKLEELARYLYELIVIFEKDNEVRNSEP